MILLGHARSINVRKVLWLGRELGLDLPLEVWGGGSDRPLDSAEFRALNPNRQVPVLRDGETVLWESNTICRYLVGRAGRDDLLPTPPAERALVEQWMDWQATDLNSAWRGAFMGLVRQSPAHADPALIAASSAAWNACMAILDAQLQRSGGHAAGPGFTLADIVLGLSTHRWYSTPMDRPDLPAVADYYRRLSMRPGFQAHGLAAGP
jgi:glutathione S-transferase